MLGRSCNKTLGFHPNTLICKSKPLLLRRFIIPIISSAKAIYCFCKLGSKGVTPLVNAMGDEVPRSFVFDILGVGMGEKKMVQNLLFSGMM